MSIPLKINDKHLYKIMLTEAQITAWVVTLSKIESLWTEADIITVSIAEQLFPSEISLIAEQYSRDANRTSDYELADLSIVNCKAKPTFTWSTIKVTYVTKLLTELQFKYEYKDLNGDVIPEKPNPVSVTYYDFTGVRTISAYVGQTIEGTLVERQSNTTGQTTNTCLYWDNFRIAFPER